MTIVVEENVLSEDAVELDEDFQKYKQKIEPFKAGMMRAFLLLCLILDFSLPVFFMSFHIPDNLLLALSLDFQKYWLLRRSIYQLISTTSQLMLLRL